MSDTKNSPNFTIFIKIDTYHIDEVEPRCVLLIIPVSIICKLPEQLNGGLGPVLLFGRHVEIVDKDQALFANRRAKDPLPTTIQLGHDDVLSLTGCGASREVDRVGNVSVKKKKNCVKWTVIIKFMQKSIFLL